MAKIEEVKEVIKKSMPELKGKYKIKLLGIFGSYARGENKKGSDIDMLVEFSKTPNMFEFIDLEDYLSNLLNIKVDLVTRKALKPRIKDKILTETTYI